MRWKSGVKMWKKLTCVCLLTIFNICDAGYIAAVVEYSSLNEPTPNQTIERNVVNYVNTIESLKQHNVQIVVFPEYGLTDLVQDPENYSIIVPPLYTSDFSNASDALLRLSNAAREHGMYVVVNVLEQDHDNSTNNTLYYNTNVVFASNGTLVAKYRKINLFQEPKLTPGNELVTFTTDFGKFGLMTCMDILYYNPSQTLLDGTNVTDVIYPAAWNSYLPFYLSLEVQVGYVLANKVNLLAANINEPSNGTGGSGIYLNDGTVLRRVITDKAATSVIFGNVDTVINTSDFILSGFDLLSGGDITRERLANYKRLRDFDHQAYTFRSLDLSKENISEPLCHDCFCCNFNIVALQNETNSSEVYKLLAYSGQTIFDSKSVQIQLCGVVGCLTDDVSTCGEIPSSAYTTKFRQISINSTYMPRNPQAFFRPMSLKGDLLTIDNATYSEVVDEDSLDEVILNFTVTTTSDNVVLFGLYGRDDSSIVSISALFIGVLFLIQNIF